ncbi:hypothetical protein T06_2627 [Trichinella sp. T6]|nr:hypothetical protein T06_2627 [Trichinella sp. T6]
MTLDGSLSAHRNLRSTRGGEFGHRENPPTEFPKAGDHGCSGHSKADALCTEGSGTDDPLHHVLERQRGRTCVGKVGRQQLKAIRPQLGIQWWYGPRWLTGPPQTWPRSREDTGRTPLIPSGRNARQDRQHRP